MDSFPLCEKCNNSTIQNSWSENNSTFQDLVEWREQRGYIVYLETVDGSSASSIKNYISDAYDNFDPPPEYVSLLGDVGGSYSLPTYYEDHGHDKKPDGYLDDEELKNLLN